MFKVGDLVTINESVLINQLKVDGNSKKHIQNIYKRIIESCPFRIDEFITDSQYIIVSSIINNDLWRFTEEELITYDPKPFINLEYYV